MTGGRIVFFLYLLLTLTIGITFRKKSSQSTTEFFLAGRNIQKLLLFFTMAATNFSAFTVFGFSGAGYRIGYSFYPVMGFGTGFMALSFHVIGKKIFLLAKERNYITPSDYIYDRYSSPLLKKLFSFIMVVFTLPYISIQAMASGQSLNSLLGIPYFAGAALVTLFVIGYVSLGGMRSIVWTDLLQSIMILGLMLTAFILIANRGGGFINIHSKVLNTTPQHFSRPGTGGAMLPGIWLGYMAMWFFADPMFPHLFQRFLAAKDKKSIEYTTVLYPLITTFLFFLTVSIGVMGRGIIPDLKPQESDRILPLLLGKFTSPTISMIILMGGLAALMSTMDSQLLTLTSMISLDFSKSKRISVLGEKLIGIFLGLVGLAIAAKPPQTILSFINKTTFYGLSVLAIPVIGGLYWKRATKYGAFFSIICGELTVIGFYTGFLKTKSILPIIPILLVTGAVFIIISLLTGVADENTDIIFPVKTGGYIWAGFFILIFILANDFWRWYKPPKIILGLPGWVWYFFALGIILTILYRVFFSFPRDEYPRKAID